MYLGSCSIGLSSANWCRSGSNHFDADPDPAYHFDADPQHWYRSSLVLCFTLRLLHFLSPAAVHVYSLDSVLPPPVADFPPPSDLYRDGGRQQGYRTHCTPACSFKFPPFSTLPCRTKFSAVIPVPFNGHFTYTTTDFNTQNPHKMRQQYCI